MTVHVYKHTKMLKKIKPGLIITIHRFTTVKKTLLMVNLSHNANNFLLIFRYRQKVGFMLAKMGLHISTYKLKWSLNYLMIWYNNDYNYHITLHTTFKTTFLKHSYTNTQINNDWTPFPYKAQQFFSGYSSSRTTS